MRIPYILNIEPARIPVLQRLVAYTKDRGEARYAHKPCIHPKKIKHLSRLCTSSSKLTALTARNPYGELQEECYAGIFDM